MTDFAAIRSQFPIFDQEIHGHPLVYLDSAATSQKPQCVIDAESDFYRTINAGVHRGAHELAARSTMAFEDARAKVAKLVGADSAEGEEEIVVTAGATAGLNLLATAFGNASLGRGGEAAKRFALKPGDEIVVQSLQRRNQSILRQSEKCRRRLLHIAQALRTAAIDQGAVVQPGHRPGQGRQGTGSGQKLPHMPGGGKAGYGLLPDAAALAVSYTHLTLPTT